MPHELLGLCAEAPQDGRLQTGCTQNLKQKPSDICAGDHLYRMNYQDFVLKHRKTGADITVAALPTDEKKATAFGLMKIDGSGRIVDFAEKPKGDELRAMRVDTTILGLDAARSGSCSSLPPPVLAGSLAGFNKVNFMSFPQTPQTLPATP